MAQRRNSLPRTPDLSQLEKDLQKSNEALALCVESIKEQETFVERHQRAVEHHMNELRSVEYKRQDLLIQRDSILKRMEIFRVYEQSGRAGEIPASSPTSSVDHQPPPAKNPRLETAALPMRPIIVLESPPRRSSTRSRTTVTIPASSPNSSSRNNMTPNTVHVPMVPHVPHAPDLRSNHRSPDHFWSTTEKAKLLGQPRSTLIPDESDRKLRCAVFHSTLPDILATSSDEGMVRLWHYQAPRRTLSKIGWFKASLFRKDQQCMESLAWHPTQTKLAMGFRDAVDGRGSVAVAEWNDDSKLHLPPTNVWKHSTTMHPKGVSCLTWLDETYLVSGGAKHELVCWNHKTQDVQTLHTHHKSEVRAVCPHSSGNAVFTGALDGMVMKYDFQARTASVVREFRKPAISKINSVLEHPANPHLLMLSAVNTADQTMHLHDLRQRTNDRMPSLVWYKAQNKSMSQYITPRWSSAGMHVSCGSTVGQVSIWDIRACKQLEGPHQTVTVHNLKVLHALWHANQNAMVTISHDRHLGVVTFQ
ncbi:Aste57867_555 [Aphanomyces stellatus]|uniref:Aste57867_555 protein n=1 Tax=Aphanomyces stellatus TaxID=120398 RepID=A0A485K396_9STRA|nr:hypothetical protein As57867_000554 [Aphanomyces stellatus]VFT77780.1 Aste57867_555 [Aphanomyces stellatus]